jgi:hypothetical protein
MVFNPWGHSSPDPFAVSSLTRGRIQVRAATSTEHRWRFWQRWLHPREVQAGGRETSGRGQLSPAGELEKILEGLGIDIYLQKDKVFAALVLAVTSTMTPEDLEGLGGRVRGALRDMESGAVGLLVSASRRGEWGRDIWLCDENIIVLSRRLDAVVQAIGKRAAETDSPIITVEVGKRIFIRAPKETRNRRSGTVVTTRRWDKEPKYLLAVQSAYIGLATAGILALSHLGGASQVSFVERLLPGLALGVLGNIATLGVRRFLSRGLHIQWDDPQ